MGEAVRQSLISQMTAPEETVWPTSADRPLIVPALCAVSGCSIFMASRTTMVSPAAKLAIVPPKPPISVSPKFGLASVVKLDTPDGGVSMVCNWSKPIVSLSLPPRLKVWPATVSALRIRLSPEPRLNAPPP